MSDDTGRRPPFSLEDGRRVLAAQPFSVLLQARLTELADSYAVIEVDVRPELLQQNGHLHGGVLGYAADNAITYAGACGLGTPSVLTGGLSIEYLRPARGRVLRARAEVAHAGRMQAVCRCELTMLDGLTSGADDPESTLCAVAQGSVLARRP